MNMFKQNRICTTQFNEHTYYFVVYGYAASEHIIAEKLKVKLKTIKNFFLKECNGVINHYGNILFATEQDAQKALDYLESIEFANTLK